MRIDGPDALSEVGDSFHRTVCLALHGQPISYRRRIETGSLSFWMAFTTKMYSGPICVNGSQCVPRR